MNVVLETVSLFNERFPGKEFLNHATLRDALESRQVLATASALIRNTDSGQFLMIFHRKYGRWLQPGGHIRASENPPDAADREAREETGIEAIRIHPWHTDNHIPIDIDFHRAANEVHLDLMYFFSCQSDIRENTRNDEAICIRWFSAKKIERLHGTVRIGQVIQRAVREQMFDVNVQTDGRSE